MNDLIYQLILLNLLVLLFAVIILCFIRFEMGFKIYWANFFKCWCFKKPKAVEDRSEGVRYAYCPKCKRRMVEESL